MKRLCKPIFLVLILAMTTLVWSTTYDTATPLGSNAPSVIDDSIRDVKAAVQERQNVDHYWPLTGTQVSDADAGKHRQVTFQAQLATPTVAADEAMLYTQDVDGGAGAATELFYQGEGDLQLQITELNAAGNAAALNITGTYENEVNFSNTGNTFLGDVFTVTDTTGYLTLPADSTDTNEGNIRYDDTGDTVSYRTASAWATVLTATDLAFSDAAHGSALANGSTLTVDVGFAPDLIIAWNDAAAAENGDFWLWSSLDNDANKNMGTGALITSSLRISVSGTQISFGYSAAGNYPNRNSGVNTMFYIALNLRASVQNPT